MFTHVDYYFNYKYLVSFILIQKTSSVKNTYALPVLKNVVLFFSLSSLMDLDDVSTYNYIYLFRFFFGNSSFFTKFNSTFSLGRSSYDFNMNSFFYGRYSFFPLMFLVNEIMYSDNKQAYSYFFYGCTFNLSFYDMNFFLEKKNNLALFNLSDFLHWKFNFSCKNYKFYDLLVSSLKVF